VTISNHRIIDIEDGQVKFNWRDYRDNNQQKNHDPLGGRVHPAISAPRFTEWVPPHSLLRVPRESTLQGEVGA
jgi:hypothetical protein